MRSIDTDGRIVKLNVVHGTAPFLEPVLNAVRTWTFSPAQMDGRVVQARMGIVFQFPQSFLPKLTAGEPKYARPSEDTASHGALPLITVEPAYPPNTVAEGSVILYDCTKQPFYRVPKASCRVLERGRRVVGKPNC